MAPNTGGEQKGSHLKDHMMDGQGNTGTVQECNPLQCKLKLNIYTLAPRVGSV